ncbi:mediator for RNA polymerase II transcription subunit 21 [Coccidioides immitis RS]|nr:mediator for RNA polymerase II transcription subunit 21 [Coccidioides immitis RS]EAS34017.2 mediator for RNA polymerase II transcription subunit 21 [Coccidioides immitis RS]
MTKQNELVATSLSSEPPQGARSLSVHVQNHRALWDQKPPNYPLQIDHHGALLSDKIFEFWLMADILTQLQTCLDQLATQFYATVAYLTTYHDHSPAIPPPSVPSAVPQLKKIPKNPPPAAPTSGTATNTPGAAGGPSGDTKDAAAGPSNAPQMQQQHQEQPPDAPPRPDSPNTFLMRQRELARDLIIKEQQIEYLISVLPGIKSSEAEQQERIKQLAEELRVVEEERSARRRELRRLGEKVDGLLGAVSRGTGISNSG